MVVQAVDDAVADLGDLTRPNWEHLTADCDLDEETAELIASHAAAQQSCWLGLTLDCCCCADPTAADEAVVAAVDHCCYLTNSRTARGIFAGASSSCGLA